MSQCLQIGVIMVEHMSEVARLRRQIELEYMAAARGLEGYAHAARHDFIETRMSNLGACHQQLAGLIGEHEAIRIVVDVIEQSCILE
ncbi:MAG TPA: hypothetical protein VKX46_05555 [Ktedonobacteraceae bacterium]|nr:hypothetical protein [Ktedonobacteraceae bacterium]